MPEGHLFVQMTSFVSYRCIIPLLSFMMYSMRKGDMYSTNRSKLQLLVITCVINKGLTKKVKMNICPGKIDTNTLFSYIICLQFCYNYDVLFAVCEVPGTIHTHTHTNSVRWYPVPDQSSPRLELNTKASRK